MRNSILAYLLVLAVFGLGIHLILQRGRSVDAEPSAASGEAVAGDTQSGALSPAASGQDAGAAAPLVELRRHAQEPLARLLLQLLTIVIAARACGSLFTRLRQPAVIGEMLAGILLGPSLFGWLAPRAFGFVFAPQSLGTLWLLSQVGICLFLFVVGMDLDLDHLRGRAHTAVVVSHASILAPYFLGVTAALWLYPDLAGPRASFTTFALFMGLSLSITAFPVLARILQDRGLSQTPLGTTAITCAAVDDVTAWSILAFVVAVAHARGLAASVSAVVLTAVYVATMLFVVRPNLPHWLGPAAQDAAPPHKGLLAAVLAFLLVSGLLTELIGIHALFGSFLAGVVMPRSGLLRRWLKLRIDHLSSVLLLPLFFAFTGLRTQVGLLNDWPSWAVCLAIILLATLGKLGASMLTARATGMSWREAFALGALMNTRGLMELIALNIGYDLGILSPRIFAMLVLMALVTTLLTGPLLPRWKPSAVTPRALAAQR